MVGSKVLAELANSKGLPAAKVFALEGHGALDIPHPTVLLNVPIADNAQSEEKKYKERCFLDPHPRYINHLHLHGHPNLCPRLCLLR